MMCTLRQCCWVLTTQEKNVVCRKQMQTRPAKSLRIMKTSCLFFSWSVMTVSQSCNVISFPGFRPSKGRKVATNLDQVKRKEKETVDLGMHKSPWQVTMYQRLALITCIFLNILWSTPCGIQKNRHKLRSTVLTKRSAQINCSDNMKLAKKKVADI